MQSDYLFFGGLTAYIAGAAAALAASGSARLARVLTCGFALTGAVLEFWASARAIFTGASPHWEIAARVPFLVYGFQLDTLSALFLLILSLLAGAVSIYSFGYLHVLEGRRTLGVLGFFFNLLLTSLTAVFTASNAFFFLVAWEVMALSAYCLVSFEHKNEETRRAGVLFFSMPVN